MTIVNFLGAAARKRPVTIDQFLDAILPSADWDNVRIRAVAPSDGHTEVAATDFAPVPEFVMHNGHPGTDKFATAMQEWLQNINIAARLAQVLLGKSKSKIMEIVRDLSEPSPDNPKITKADEFYEVLEHGCRNAERLVRMIRAGQIRMLIALSSVAVEVNSSGGAVQS